MGAAAVSAPSARPSWYALETGGWRDYVTLLHLPYTAWHLSYVVIGGCLAPVVAWGRLGAAVAAFGLAVGIGAHALDELRGRPLRTSIPDGVLVGLAAVSIAAACGIGVVGAIAFEPWLVLLVPVGLFLVVAYNLELLDGRFHSDLWFGLAWGGFPVVCGYAAVAGELSVAALLAAAFAVLLSLAQRALSNHVRFVRRRVAVVDGAAGAARRLPGAARRRPPDRRRGTRAPAARRGIRRSRRGPGGVPALESRRDDPRLGPRRGARRRAASLHRARPRRFAESRARATVRSSS